MGKTRHYKHERVARQEPIWEELIFEPPPAAPPTEQDWETDCVEWRGVVLTGVYAHWCPIWHDLPMDETCPEWPCGCGIEEVTDASE